MLPIPGIRNADGEMLMLSALPYIRSAVMHTRLFDPSALVAPDCRKPCLAS